MIRLIETEQERGNFAFCLKDRETFDIGVMEPDKRARGLWNYKKIRAYEVQTTATKSEIDRRIEKSKQNNTELIFATNGSKAKREIEQMTQDKYRVLKISPYLEAKEEIDAAALSEKAKTLLE